MRSFVVAVALCSLAGSSVIGQGLGAPVTSSWQFSWYAGPAAYAGDREAYVLDRGQYGFWYGAEMAHNLTRVLGIGIRLNTLSHPRLVDSGQYRSSLAAAIRATQAGYSVFSPFVEVGIHYIVGAGRGGSGPVVGAGLNLKATRTLSLFAAVDVNLVYPGDVLDGSVDPNHFDAVVGGRFGMRISDLRGVFKKKTPLQIQSVEVESTTSEAELVELTAILNRANPSQAVSWDFGDGQSGTGNPVQHLFREPGVFGGSVRVSGGSDIAVLPFTVVIDGSLSVAKLPASPSKPLDIAWLNLSGVEIYQPRERPSRTAAPHPVAEEPDVSAQAEAAGPAEVLNGYGWVVASRAELAAARNLASQYAFGSLDVRIIQATIQGQIWYRVVLGLFNSRSEASRNKSRLPAAAPADSWLLELSDDTPIPLAPTSDGGRSNR